MFTSRFPPGLAEVARLGDTRRPDFRCDACNFEATMHRKPVRGTRDEYLCFCDRQMVLDEWHKDAASTAKGYRTDLRRMERWGAEYRIPHMIAGNLKSLSMMPSDHRQIGWYFVDRTRKVQWATVKKERSAVWNYYQRMGVTQESIPTSTFRFAHRMDGLLQRLGASVEQAKVFSEVLIEDMVALLEFDYERAVPRRSPTAVAELSLANLAFHLYLQGGFRANEAMAERVGRFRRSWVFGAKASRKRVQPHLRVRASIHDQTKENRYCATDVLVAYGAKYLPLCTGRWAVRSVKALQRLGIAGANDFLFAIDGKRHWTMAFFWSKHVLPRLVRLQTALLGGLEDEDLSEYGGNSFRRTWTTLTSMKPEKVDVDLQERQGRWRTKQRRRDRVSLRMTSLYCDPYPQELLLASINLGSGSVQDWSGDPEQEPDQRLEPQE